MRKTFINLFSILFFYQKFVTCLQFNPKEFIKELVSEAIIKLGDNSLNTDQKNIY